MSEPIKIEKLNNRHNRKDFSCGIGVLDAYFAKFAWQHAKANISCTYVAVRHLSIAGFYSLSMSDLRKDNLPFRLQKRFPNLPLPVARLGRLAVAQAHQQQGLGQLLLIDALRRCLQISESIGMIGVVLDAKDEHVRTWYERYEFVRLPDMPLTLFIPTAAIAGLT